MVCGRAREGVCCLLAPAAYELQAKTEHGWTILFAVLISGDRLTDRFGKEKEENQEKLKLPMVLHNPLLLIPLTWKSAPVAML